MSPYPGNLLTLCPIPKANQVTDINKDLRPISLTSSLSKIAEEIIIIRDLKPSLMKNIDPNQFGFIPGSSTTQALIYLIHRWSQSTDGNGASVRSLLLDYRKAFDLVDHTILIRKLTGLGLMPSVFKWIVDFLSGRYQRVKFLFKLFL